MPPLHAITHLTARDPYQSLNKYILYIYLEYANKYAYECDFLFLYKITENCEAPEALCHGMKIASFFCKGWHALFLSE